MKLFTVSAVLCAMICLATTAEEHHHDKTSACCPAGWTRYRKQCYIYVSEYMTWAEAQKNCQSMNANQASVQSLAEYQRIQQVIFDATQENRLAWLGGSDAQQEGYWFWINGAKFKYTNWCPGEPSNYLNTQHCIQMNYSQEKCWDDQICDTRLPSVCVKKIKQFLYQH
uniref:C-type lectin domain-containing protein n=1 Tax=Oreochromis niloticus TaxID=8128 RepID=I3K9E2_ORENI